MRGALDAVTAKPAAFAAARRATNARRYPFKVLAVRPLATTNRSVIRSRAGIRPVLGRICFPAQSKAISEAASLRGKSGSVTFSASVVHSAGVIPRRCILEPPRMRLPVSMTAVNDGCWVVGAACLIAEAGDAMCYLHFAIPRRLSFTRAVGNDGQCFLRYLSLWDLVCRTESSRERAD